MCACIIIYIYINILYVKLLDIMNLQIVHILQTAYSTSIII